MSRCDGRSGERGFSIVELLIAMLVTVTCLLGVALMMLYGTRLAAASREATLASAFARAEVERIRLLPRSAAERQPGGQLGSDVPDHFATRGRYTSRWQVAPGPAGTQDVSLVVLAAADAHVPMARLRVLLR
jgi:Tfp pilus assembly protein PilV